MPSYSVQEWRGGLWVVTGCFPGMTLAHAAEVLEEMDREVVYPQPRRVVDDAGRTIFSGRHCSRNTPTDTIKPVWIVMSLDKPGPCERGERPYTQHETKEVAKAEARRLSAACQGGRFGVFELIHVVGWVDFDLEVELPF